jgi:monofunctional glycosyltransferase
MRNFFQQILKWAKYAVLVFLSVSIFSVIFFRFVNPPITPLMLMRYITHDSDQGKRKIEKKWVSFDEISPNMIQAVIAAEDNKFPTHYGIDFEAIEQARRLNKYSKIKHGASTISQQTAKNLFLFPSRTYLRKGFELYFTLLMETCWSKKRILEVYLNIIELGDGVYGVEAASNRYFHKSASKLSRSDAALITAVLPSPLRRNLAHPNGYMRYYQGRVLNLMDKIGKIEL